VFGLLTALGIGVLTEQANLKEDTAIGVIFAGLFALGVALLSTSNNYTVDLAHFLFGNLLGVSRGDLWVIGLLGAIVLGTLFLFYKELLVISFDQVLAVTLRLPSRFLRYLLLILIAVTVVTALQVVGIALMLAMFVTPAATASLLTRRLPTMMLVSALIGSFSGVAGLYASYYLNIASGAAVVLVASIIFILVFLFAPGQGFIWRQKNKTINR
jgi:ABC-type Mn2+/Zn2+ transport system permease subunit